MTTFALAVTMRVHDGEEQRVEELLEEMNRLTRAEEGCLFLLLHRDLGEPGTFFIYEQWVDRDAHRAHLETDHFKNIAEAELLPRVDFEVQELEPYEVPASQAVG
jgi:quinol monooxygenase YgiN